MVRVKRCTVSSVRQRVGVGPAGGEVEHAAAPDRRQLVPVPHQRDPRAVLVGDREQRAGGVLVEHPGLVHQQQITWRAASPRRSGRVYVTPVTGSIVARCRRVQAPSSSHRKPCW